MALNQNEKLIKNMEKMQKTMETITAKDECVKICETIWSCKNPEQKDACYNMLKTYKDKHGDDNVGITFIQIELARLEHIIKIQTQRAEQMKAAQERQQAAVKEADKQHIPQPNGDGKIVDINTVVPNSAKGDKK
tara:strand:+ start:91 stop:495 length:405 start_codon:yes stop_codon:yes gene_type:complete